MKFIYLFFTFSLSWKLQLIHSAREYAIKFNKPHSFLIAQKWEKEFDKREGGGKSTSLVKSMKWILCTNDEFFIRLPSCQLKMRMKISCDIYGKLLFVPSNLIFLFLISFNKKKKRSFFEQKFISDFCLRLKQKLVCIVRENLLINFSFSTFDSSSSLSLFKTIQSGRFKAKAFPRSRRKQEKKMKKHRGSSWCLCK